MKRKIFLSIIIFIILISGLFLLTGCKKNDSNVKETPVEDLHKSEFVDMRYNEPSNYLKKEPMGLADYKVISYTFTEEGKSINLYYNKGKDYSKEVDTIIIPNVMYLNKTLKSDCEVNYTVSEMSKKIVLSTDGHGLYDTNLVTEDRIANENSDFYQRIIDFEKTLLDRKMRR